MSEMSALLFEYGLSPTQAVPIFASSIVAFIAVFWLVYFKVICRPNTVIESFPFEFPYTILTRMNIDLLDVVKDGYFKAKTHYKGLSTFTGIIPFMYTMVIINDPINVEHVLKTNFENYEKGPEWYSRMKDFLGEGIFSSDGDIWLRHRKTSSKLFNMNIFRGTVMHQFNEHLDTVIKILKASNGKPLDFQDLIYRFTLDSIGQIAFGHEIGSLTSDKNYFADDFDSVQKACVESFLDPLWYIKRYYTPLGRQFFSRVKRLDKFAVDIIQKRRADEARNKQTQDEEFSKRTDLVSLYLSRQSTDGEISDKQLRDIILNFLIAGRDTTAQALSWSMYRLCIHPNVLVLIRKEIDEVLASASTSSEPLLDENGWPTYETLHRLKYLDAFCHEVLRLHPSVPKEAKFAKKDDVLPDGTPVKKGDCILFFPWLMARTESLWKNCLEFQPERFYNQSKPSPFLYTSFQAGPRVCLGQNLALLEMKCCLMRLVRTFDFKLEQDPSTVTYQNSLTLPILGGLKISARPL